MENIRYYISQAPREFHKLTLLFENKFLEWTENIDFTIFCIIYTVFLITLLRCLNKT
jgi:hypothetical protein